VPSEKAEEEKEGKKVIRSERYYGSVYRSLPWTTMWIGRVPSQYADGVLELTLPKKAGHAGKEIKCFIGGSRERRRRPGLGMAP